MKKVLKALLPPKWRTILETNLGMPRRIFVLEKQVRLLAQQTALSHYAGQVPQGRLKSPLNQHELKVFSQNGEDGILLYLFSLVGVTDRRFIEFGVGDGMECNGAHLAIHCGWHGLMMDCVESNIACARSFYAERLGPAAPAIELASCFITAENVNETFRSHGFEGEIDLLSIDIDGNDYWVWKAIDCVTPRVVVVEYNACLGFTDPITVTYDPTFNRFEKHPSLLYFGASLSALTKLAQAKGYLLAGCDQHGVNAFFVREDVAAGKLEALTPEQAFFPLQDRLLGLITPADFRRIEDMTFETV
ncbi:MAG TPA: hypothetical protein ENN80_11505 [Candidatus Hydrogenedentes bacterium]|nr:hypothetical protein [Candidatus Hydrogenedentota bacterium]